MSIEDRLIRLETLTEEKWATHDKSSVEHWNSIKKTLDELRNDVQFNSNRVMELPCKERIAINAEKFKNIDKWLGVNWWVTGIILAAIIAEWIKGR